MKSMLENLPREIAQRIHPDWRKNEQDYWAKRDELLAQYRDRWIAFDDGTVVASGSSPVKVLHTGQRSGRHPFVTCVGREQEPSRMRRIVSAYDRSYPNEPLPVIEVEFRRQPDDDGLVLDRVIPDTGADASAQPWSDCVDLQLDPMDGVPGWMGGVADSSAATVMFDMWAHVDGVSYPCRLQADFHGNERILGRDVLNGLVVTFCGPKLEVIINP